MSPLLLRLSFYQSDLHGHGGVHRTAQVAELLRATGLEVPAPPQPTAVSASEGRTTSAKDLVGRFLPRLRAWVAGRRRIARLRKSLMSDPGAKVMIWENTKQLFHVREAYRHAIRVVAVPQNLEALDRPERTSRSEMLDALGKELDVLLAADAVFTLSREDTWFLRVCGANAFHLPYYPSAELERELLSVRVGRAARTPARFLLVGSAVHESTRRSLQEALVWLCSARARVPFHLDVAGFGTETLRAFADHPDFVVHGAVTPVHLREMQSHARAAIVHHTAYSGSLTRVVEMLLAGIPVLANEDGGRAAPYEGVHLYRTVDELSHLLGTEFKVPPPPPKPLQEERFFVETVKRLAG